MKCKRRLRYSAACGLPLNRGASSDLVVTRFACANRWPPPGSHPRAGFVRKRLAERIGQLPRNLGRKRRLLVDAILLRQLVFRKPEGPEQNIPKRESAGKIGVAAHFRRGVMPAVEHRAGKHVSE